MSSTILNAVLFWSSVYNMDPYVTLKVIQVESNYNVNAVGSRGELGLMQLMPSTFPMYTKRQLLEPTTNVRLGVEYLSNCKKKCIHQKNVDWLICYNVGISGGSRYRYPRLSQYLRKYYD